MAAMKFLMEKFLGPIVRQVPSSDKALYLTFDDGPGESTAAVLALLKELNVTATFFVVATNAQKNLNILKAIQAQGHAIGNHSFDHTYSPFIKGRSVLLKWIQNSEESLNKLLGHSTVGFRPPNGIVTPELKWALGKMNMPLILWNHRFFDKVYPWTLEKAARSLSTAEAGDIILLHDIQADEKLPLFLKTLRAYIADARERSFQFRPLTRELCEQAKQLKLKG